MTRLNTRTRSALIAVLALAAGLLLGTTLQAATTGITAAAPAGGVASPGNFNLTAAASYISQPDGTAIYSWGYGCAGTTVTFAPAAFATLGFCPTMQVPGPTLIVTEGQPVTVTLTNNLPGATIASIVFPGFKVTASGGVPGLLTSEATPGTSVTYTFVATSPGTRGYYSGTQTDFQVEMGLYGAIVVLPSHVPANCTAIGSDVAQKLGIGNPGDDLRLAPAAYDHPETCYDREYLFQWMELDSRIHRQAEEQAQKITSCALANNQAGGVACPTTFDVRTEPYRPNYYLINGRSMPDDMDPDYAPNYPHQPYNGNPHMHPGDLVLVRTIGQGRWRHPFHQHGNHVRILARDANLLLSQNDPLAGTTTVGGVTTTTAARLAGRMEFTTDTYPGQAYDGIFYWSGKGLGWDIYGHTPNYATAIQTCIPDANGYY